MSELTVSVVIPAFNEGAAIAGVVESVRQALQGRTKALEVIVVDDGSSDDTAGAAERAHATVLRHPANRGYGRALITGIEAARHDWILMIDADGSYPGVEAAKLLEFAPAFDLVIGARTGAYYWGTPVQALRRKIYLAIARFAVGEDVPDANSGLRLVRRSMVLGTGPVRCFGYSFTTTMTLSFLSAGRWVKYVPIAFEARTGSSKVRMMRDVLRTLQLMTQVLLAFNPLKLFVALSVLPLALGALYWLAYFFAGDPMFLLVASICGAASVMTFAAGCILDSIRMHNPSK